MECWQYHNQKMKELKQIYNRISKQKQNRIQELLDTFKFNSETLYNICSTKDKKRINSYIDLWQDKGLLNGYFGMIAKNIYNRTRVKNSEILELLIYGAYIEEQSKLEDIELNIFKEDMNYYYIQGQEEVIKTQKSKKKTSVIPDAIFLALIDMPNSTGLNWKQYIETTMQYNAQQLCKQVILNTQQQKELEIQSNEFQRIIQQQNNQKLNINNNKISGAVDMQMIGLNNLAKVEGIKELADDNDMIEFIAVSDENSTDMCQSMNGMKFYINKENSFDRYWGATKKELKLVRVKVKGLVPRNQPSAYNLSLALV